MATKRAKLSDKSQGDKTVQCVRCSGAIQPYAARAVDLLGKHWAHHLGKCADRSVRESAMRAAAATQSELFAWSCGKITPDVDYGNGPEVCDVASTDRASYVEHMKAHGLRELQAPAMIKLRKRAPAAKLAPINVPKPFKMLSWTEHYDTWTDNGIYGQRRETTEVQRRGQFWSNGADAHSIWAITYTAPGSGIKPELVQLWVAADGSVTRNWSDAHSSRREANRVARWQAA